MDLLLWMLSAFSASLLDIDISISGLDDRRDAYTAELAFPDEIGFAATPGDVVFFLGRHQSSSYGSG